MVKQRQNNNKVQITLDDDDAKLYNMIRHKKGFFSAMLNMAYKNQAYRDMFFDIPEETIQHVQHVSIEKENAKEQKTTQKKKISVSSW